MDIVDEMNAAQPQPNSETQEEDRGIPTHAYNLLPRPVKPRQQLNLLQTGQQSTHRVHTRPHEHVQMTQMSMRAGVIGQKGNDVLLKELNQLHSKDALLPIKKDYFSDTDKKRALWYLLFIKEKRDGAIKVQ